MDGVRTGSGGVPLRSGMAGGGRRRTPREAQEGRADVGDHATQYVPVSTPERHAGSSCLELSLGGAHSEDVKGGHCGVRLGG